ncbi:MAG: MFS transporter, partial [Alicyclobacillus sp.]|nr:MFS transporter [Alicyclobacillus sp.]
YMVVNTVLILVFGQFADIFGRRKLYLMGLGGFAFFSFLSGWAPDIRVLIALRALQATGGALVVTNTTALLADSFPRQQLGTALGINVLVSAAAQLLGPAVGGFLASHLNWRWVFWFNVPFGVVGFFWGLRTLRANQRRRQEQVDLLGGLLALLALGGLATAFTAADASGSGQQAVYVGAGLFIVFGPLFIWRELRTPSPLLDLGLFKHRAYAMAYVATFLNAFARSSVVLLFGLFFQVVGHDDTFHAGLQVLPVTVGLLLASPLAGRLADRFEPRLIATLGLSGVTAGLVILIGILSPQPAYAVIAVGMFCIGFGSGMFLTPNTTAIMTSISPDKRGMANGLRSMLNNMGQVMSAAISLWALSIPLPERLRAAVYQGAAAQVQAQDSPVLVTGFRWALVLLVLATLLGIAASAMRGPRQGGKEAPLRASP